MIRNRDFGSFEASPGNARWGLVTGKPVLDGIAWVLDLKSCAENLPAIAPQWDISWQGQREFSPLGLIGFLIF
ncbi:hypothetical protein [Picosynechococcus sp. PCC 73109]|uniref:hypothetical protein n=1 Tax=Picosynechococcus sp. PCC 73109 TaxID=374982 RepID=UPI0007458AF3|nr:hypothetical protein AWQ23_15525 [Picosynechococcus sp. PCC 73109]